MPPRLAWLDCEGQNGPTFIATPKQLRKPTIQHLRRTNVADWMLLWTQVPGCSGTHLERPHSSLHRSGTCQTQNGGLENRGGGFPG